MCSSDLRPIVVKSPIFWLTIPIQPKSEGLGKTDRLGYAILGFAFNRGFFDVILPAAHLYRLCASIHLLSAKVKKNLEKIFCDAKLLAASTYDESGPPRLF